MDAAPDFDSRADTTRSAHTDIPPPPPSLLDKTRFTSRRIRHQRASLAQGALRVRSRAFFVLSVSPPARVSLRLPRLQGAPQPSLPCRARTAAPPPPPRPSQPLPLPAPTLSHQQAPARRARRAGLRRRGCTPRSAATGGWLARSAPGTFLGRKGTHLTRACRQVGLLRRAG